MSGMSDERTTHPRGAATRATTSSSAAASSPSVGDALGPAVAKVLVVHPPTLGARGRGAARAAAGDRFEVLLAEIPDAEAGQARRGRRVLLAGHGPGRLHPHRRRRRLRRGSGHRPRRLRRRDVAARRARSCRCRRPCSAWSTPPSAARPASTPHEGKNLVGAFYAPAAVLCDLDLLDTLLAQRDPRRLRRGREGRLHLRTPRSSTSSRRTPTPRPTRPRDAFRRVDRARDRA